MFEKNSTTVLSSTTTMIIAFILCTKAAESAVQKGSRLLLRIPNVKVNKTTIQSAGNYAHAFTYPVHKIKSMLSPIFDFMKAKTDVSKSPEESQW